jgi:phage-related protein
MLLRQLQNGESLGMPHAEPLPIIGPRCGALRIPDAGNNWRIIFRVDPDAVLILEVYSKKTRKMPDEVVERCQKRITRYDTIAGAAKKPKKK